MSRINIGQKYLYKGNIVKLFGESNSRESVWITVPLLNGEMIGLNVMSYKLTEIPEPTYVNTMLIPTWEAFEQASK